MDSYYLAIEKMYVYKYNTFLSKLNEGNIDYSSIYDMNPKNTNLKYEFISYFIQALLSFSVICYYGIFVIITIMLIIK